MPSQKKPVDVLTNRVSVIMAAVFALPALTIFLGIYHITGNILAGAIPGFGIHFVTLAFSGRISAYLDSKMN
ncbi:MAG: hypothetical protein D9C04_04520 [Nitrosopumilus sp. B06]|nr:MAG: hypothetical protein EB828_00520 [Nitrosopumilus sp. D6]RNJ79482.1 MAG: hypothetical protein D9C04_04520 [Nitrosopumilus sp. B06]